MKISKQIKIFIALSLAIAYCNPLIVYARPAKKPVSEPKQLRKIAQRSILKDNITEAIIQYKELVQATEAPDPAVLCEYAYALALGGFYDFALANIDRARMLDTQSELPYYYAAQVFLLTGYVETSLPEELWQNTMIKKTPKWIKKNAKRLIEKYKNKGSQPKIKDAGQEFNKANILLSQQCYFQALSLFEALTKQFSDQYIFYMGYALALEKAGAPESAIAELKTAQKLAQKQKAEEKVKEEIAGKIQNLEDKINAKSIEEIRANESLELIPAKSNVLFFIGGTADKDKINIRTRIGIYEDGSEGGIDIGYDNDQGKFSTGVSVRKTPLARSPGLIEGFGVKYTFPGYSLIGTVGFTLPLGKGGTRIDYLLDIEGWKSGSSEDMTNIITFTIGFTFL